MCTKVLKRTVACCWLMELVFMLLTSASAGAEGLFPTFSQLFGISMPSIGRALDRTADESVETEDGKREVYRDFTYDDYYAFGVYLAGTGAVLDSSDVTPRAIAVTISVRGASMQFTYDWLTQTATAVYPSGTRDEPEKEAVEPAPCLLPRVGGMMPSEPSLGEALHRYPDTEIQNEDGSRTEVYLHVSAEEFNVYSVYLSGLDAAMTDYQTKGSVFSASIQLEGQTFSFSYDSLSLEARLTYPPDTYDMWLESAKIRLQVAKDLMAGGEYEEALQELHRIPYYRDFAPVAELVANDENLQAAAAIREAKLVPFRSVGSYVTFGSYEQDNNTANGQEPIEWLVLDYDAVNNRALLISRYGLDVQPYHQEDTRMTWEKCMLRTWLNDTFLNKAFTTQEQTGIIMTNVDNSSQGYSKFSTSGGNNTQDMIFLLSYAEANKYFGVTLDDSENTRSRAEPTVYALGQGASTFAYKTAPDGAFAGRWWLRSPGEGQSRAALVDYDGSLTHWNVNLGGGCVRPALWINLESGIF